MSTAYPGGLYIKAASRKSLPKIPTKNKKYKDVIGMKRKEKENEI